MARQPNTRNKSGYPGSWNGQTGDPYTSIAANQPTGRTKAGVDNWKVVGGQPEGDTVGERGSTAGTPDYYAGKSKSAGGK